VTLLDPAALAQVTKLFFTAMDPCADSDTMEKFKPHSVRYTPPQSLNTVIFKTTVVRLLISKVFETSHTPLGWMES
jgi:hypothetical protein